MTATRKPTAAELLEAFDAMTRADREADHIIDRVNRGLDRAKDRVVRVAKRLGYKFTWWPERAEIVKLARAEKAAAKR